MDKQTEHSGNVHPEHVEAAFAVTREIRDRLLAQEEKRIFQGVSVDQATPAQRYEWQQMSEMIIDEWQRAVSERIKRLPEITR